jgi:hypothetical protein
MPIAITANTRMTFATNALNRREPMTSRKADGSASAMTAIKIPDSRSIAIAPQRRNDIDLPLPSVRFMDRF